MLSEKIARLRRQFGWSQEELAEQLDVSRQSVSKWESGASQPEVDKVLALSRLFGVSTDALLKDDPDDLGAAPRWPDADFGAATAVQFAPEAEAEEEEEEADAAEPEAARVYVPDEVQDGLRVLSEAEARRFLENRRQCAPIIGRGVAMCVASPAPMLCLLGLGERLHLSPGLAIGGGLAALLAMVAGAVGLFVSTGMRMSKYSAIDREPFALTEALRDDIDREKQFFRGEFSRSITEGVGLCMLSPVPVCAAAIAGMGGATVCLATALLLAMIALGTSLFTRDGIIMGSFSHVLQEGDYALPKKLRRYKAAHLIKLGEAFLGSRE